MRDPIEIEVFKNLFHAIAEEMGAALRRTAFSPNIKERRDYSCAVFDARGQVIAMGDHMPVHLGSMPMSVRAAMDALQLAPGDVAMLNDPFRGGTHLPDITLVAPVFLADLVQRPHPSGEVQRDALALLLNNVRTPAEREGDLRAQLASCHTGAERLRELCRRYELPRVRDAATELLDYSEQLMRAFLRRVPPGIYHAEDFL